MSHTTDFLAELAPENTKIASYQYFPENTKIASYQFFPENTKIASYQYLHVFGKLKF